MSESGITVTKSERFSEWYTQAVLRSELADYAPIKGCIIFREDSYAIWEKIQDYFNKKIGETGHRRWGIAGSNQDKIHTLNFLP